MIVYFEWCLSELGGYGNAGLKTNGFAVRGAHNIPAYEKSPHTTDDYRGHRARHRPATSASCLYYLCRGCAKRAGLVLSCVSCPSQVGTINLIRAQQVAVLWAVGHKRGRLTPLAVKEATGLATAQEQQRRVSTAYFVAVPSGLGLLSYVPCSRQIGALRTSSVCRFRYTGLSTAARFIFIAL